MRLVQRIVILTAIVAVTLGLVACEQAPWRMADQSVAALARDVADRAASNDTQYFRALTPDRAAVPGLIQQIMRSGIATNYASHLIIASPDSATLAYGLSGDDTTATSFALELSLVEGKPRLDQIVTIGGQDLGGSPGTLSVPVASSKAAASEVGSVSVSVSIASDRVSGYGLHSALIAYTNTSDEATSVAVPLDTAVRITDSQDALVSEGPGQTDTLESPHRELLPPWSTIYASVQFRAPMPGRYALRSRANGVWSSTVNLETTR
jgi:hypothetical protein